MTIKSSKQVSCDASTEDIEEALKETNCATLGSSCTVEIVSTTCNTSRRYLFRRVDRGLQAGAVELVVDFVTIVTAYCSDEQCSNGSDVADAIYETVTTTFQKSILDDTFVNALIAADSTGTFFSSGITIDDVSFSEVIAPLIDKLNDWYPDFGKSHTCLNDGKAPRYSKFFCTL